MNIQDVSTSPASLSVCLAHHVVEDEAGVRQFEVFEQTVELPAVQRTPGTVEVVSGLRLLPRVVVVLELNRRKDKCDGRKSGNSSCTKCLFQMKR